MRSTKSKAILAGCLFLLQPAVSRSDDGPESATEATTTAPGYDSYAEGLRRSQVLRIARRQSDAATPIRPRVPPATPNPAAPRTVPAAPATTASPRPATPAPATPASPTAAGPTAPSPAQVNNLLNVIAPVLPEGAGNAGAAALAAPGFDDADDIDVRAELVVQGDQAPFSLLRAAHVPNATPRPPVPPVPPVPRPGSVRAPILIPWARGFKIADNQSPRPQDRVFFTFNYFNSLNVDLNKRLGNTYYNMNIYRELFGFEKTFLDGLASLGIRVPVNSITADSPVRGLGGTRTSFGNITVFGKYVLWQDAKSNLISTGLAVTVPNGPTSFAGANYAGGFREVNLQPFVGYFFSNDRFYLQGFESIDVPTDSNDVTMLYNDIAVGYFLYKSKAHNPIIRAVAPTFETHVNVPLNHQGILVAGDPAATYPVVDLTFGLNIFALNRSVLSASFVEAVTGPRPFSYEFSLFYNFYFGRTGRLPQTIPGILGN